jgi:hypothetical protein
MIDNSFPESKLEWFLSKFKNEKGEITASDIRKKGDKKYSNSDWRVLMSLAVQRGYAKDNGKYSRNDKYGIYLIHGERIIFDIDSMNPSIFFNLPPCVLMNYLTVDQKLFHNLISERWIKIYEAFSNYCAGEDVEFFSEDEDFDEMISITAKKFICLYQLIKLGWEEITKKITALRSADYNDFFYQILLMDSILEFTQAISEDAAHPRSNYEKQKKRMVIIKNAACSNNEAVTKDEAVEILGKSKYNSILGDRAEELNIFSKSSFVQEIMSKSNMPQEQILLKEWLAVGDCEAYNFAKYLVIKKLLAESENFQLKELVEDLRRAEDALLEYELRRQRKNLEGKEEILQRRQWSKDDDSTMLDSPAKTYINPV